MLQIIESCALEKLDNPVQQIVLAYALKLTRAPGEITKADVESLRSLGWDDLAIHDLCAIVAYFAFVNRIADGLGVDVES